MGIVVHRSTASIDPGHCLDADVGTLYLSVAIGVTYLFPLAQFQHPEYLLQKVHSRKCVRLH